MNTSKLLNTSRRWFLLLIVTVALGLPALTSGPTSTAVAWHSSHPNGPQEGFGG